MAKRNQVAKTAPPSVPAPQPIKFDPIFATMLNDERARATRAVATLVQHIQKHQNDVYKEIRKRGIEEG